MVDQLAQNLHRRFDPRKLKILVGLVRAGDVARPKNQGFATELLKIRRFGAKGYRIGGLAGVAGQQGPALRVLSSLSLGPQQRVVTVQVGQGEHATCLVLGVAPGAVQTLHSLPLPPDTALPAPGATATGFAARLAQLTNGAR